jgi:hypothetical protein
MNKDHVVAGVGTISVTQMLADVLTNVLHQDPTAATSEAGLIVLAAGALWGLAQAWMARGKPKAA